MPRPLPGGSRCLTTSFDPGFIVADDQPAKPAAPKGTRVPCPHCGHVMVAQFKRVGKYHPHCQACGRRFDILVRLNAAGGVDLSTDVGIEDADDSLGSILGLESETIVHRKRQQPQKPQKPAARQRPAAAPSPDVTAAPTRASQPTEQTVAPTRPAAVGDGAAAVTAAPSRARPSQSRPSEPPEQTVAPTGKGPPKRLGNYELRQKLGQGGMGSVYLARQLSLDRDVALKLLADELAGDAEFVARFTREAYAAAQLTHHNIVQIYDIGSDGEDKKKGIDPTHFFSMEFVPGQNLTAFVNERGKVPATEAVSLMLQAGRGLQFAHELGLVHRDVKPENLLLNEQGVVKVADLGLAKKVGEAEPGSNGAGSGDRTGLRTMIRRTSQKLDDASAASTTQIHIAMGTPAYMAPEQSVDAANVDQRADIYALGCSLYHLLTGRPPFSGTTAAEVMTKHQSESMVPPEKVADDVPGSLGEIVMKMTAKKPGQRYPSMKQCVRALEGWLSDFEETTPQPPSEAEKRLSLSVRQYHDFPMAKARPWLIRGFIAVCLLLTVALPILLGGTLGVIAGGAALGLLVTTVASHILLRGTRQQTYLWQQIKALAVEASVLDWLGVVVVGGAMLVVLYSLGWLGWWLGVAVLGFGIAAGFYFGVDEPLAKQRLTPLSHIHSLLKRLRGTGYDENNLRHFAATKSGDRWEAVYEELFGFEDKMDARKAFAPKLGNTPKPRHAAWREPVLRWIEIRLDAKKLRRNEKLLIEAEKRVLRRRGIGEEIAEKQAKANAIKYVGMVQGFRRDAEEKVALHVPKPADEAFDESPDADEEQSAGNAEDAIRRKAVKYTDEDFERVRESWFHRRYGSPIDIFLAPGTRFVLGLLLVPFFAFWLNTAAYSAAGDSRLDARDRNVEINAENTTAGGSRQTRSAEELEGTLAVSVDDLSDNIATELKRYELWNQTLGRVLPSGLLWYLTGWSVGIAAIILVTSVVFDPRLFAVLTLISAALAIFLKGIPIPGTEIEITWWMSSIVGFGLYFFALTFFRTDEGY